MLWFATRLGQMRIATLAKPAATATSQEMLEMSSVYINDAIKSKTTICYYI